MVPARRMPIHANLVSHALMLLALTILVPARARCAEPEPLPAQADIQALFDQSKYQQVLQKLSRVLVLRGPAAAPYDRHQLLRIKGETFLRMKSPDSAGQAFGEAAKETKDATAAAVDAATQLLIRRSQNAQYTPKFHEKTKPGDPINIIESEQRKAALVALFHDELTVQTPKIKAVRDSRSLVPILQIMPTINTLRLLEVGATGGHDDETKKLIGELARHAQNLMGDVVQEAAKETDATDKMANQLIQYVEYSNDPTWGSRRELKYRKRGLNQADQRTLSDIVATCEQIIPATRDLGEALGTDGADMEAVRTAADKVGRKADIILHADYRGTYTNPSGQ